jgi:hypothetical protein
MEKDMLDVNSERAITPNVNNLNAANNVNNLNAANIESRPAPSIWVLFIRSLPLIISLILFVFAASTDITRWGRLAIQTILCVAVFFGIIGIALFIPKRYKIPE